MTNSERSQASEPCCVSNLSRDDRELTTATVQHTPLRNHSIFGFRALSFCRHWLWAALLLLPLTQAGCLKEMLFLGYLIGGPPSIEPDFDIMTKKSMTAKDVTIAVVCYAPLEVKYEFSAIDAEIAKFVTFRLVQHKMKVVNPDQVRAWLDEHTDWDEPSEIGRALNVKYVVYIDLENFNLWEENSRDLYRGRAEGLVSVFEIDENGDGEKIYAKEINSKFPILEPRAATDLSYSTFKQNYLTRLSEEIGRLFYEQFNGDDIHEAT